jgi:SAM-dependent methyltransferase
MTNWQPDNPRRRGLNMLSTLRVEPIVDGDEERIVTPPPYGWLRLWYWLRLAARSKHTPHVVIASLSIDAVNQVVGRTTIYNRDILEISSTKLSSVFGYVERGARVTRLVPEDIPTPFDTSQLPYREFRGAVSELPAESFDVIIATNRLFSSTTRNILDECLRILRVGACVVFFEVTHFGVGEAQYPSATKRRIRRFIDEALRTGEFAVVSEGPRFVSSGQAWLRFVPGFSHFLRKDVVIALEKVPVNLQGRANPEVS